LIDSSILHSIKAYNGADMERPLSSHNIEQDKKIKCYCRVHRENMQIEEKKMDSCLRRNDKSVKSVIQSCIFLFFVRVF